MGTNKLNKKKSNSRNRGEISKNSRLLSHTISSSKKQTRKKIDKDKGSQHSKKSKKSSRSRSRQNSFGGVASRTKRLPLSYPSNMSISNTLKMVDSDTRKGSKPSDKKSIEESKQMEHSVGIGGPLLLCNISSLNPYSDNDYSNMKQIGKPSNDMIMEEATGEGSDLSHQKQLRQPNITHFKLTESREESID